ncbi:SIR2 family protein [Thermosipho ferrireducens]|uniref:SIR2 family protein n=1 Tax=Thermosipho ferrireducens TaxID=2571116 RepID=A0ABX7S7E6_9BACT|nr:SIR2 family protein [Thermosipho ferrireducens]QTA38509.1 SIR2 family protein [Thermosipho ferrireducens]
MEKNGKIENVFLLGNGFNYSIRDFIEDKNLKNEINKIINLWEEFAQFFSEIKNMDEYESLSDENIIDIIHKSISLLGLLPLINNKNLEKCLEKIKTEFFNKINDKLLNIVEKFVEIEESGIYKQIANFYHNHTEYNFYKFIEENKISIYTTNYDGIAEIIFAYDKDEISENKIKLRDMFGYGDYYYNAFDFNNYFRDENESKLLHLHGSYKFFSYQGDFIKIKKEGWYFYRKNKDMLSPILIFNAPGLKEKQIKNFSVLSVYFKSFERELTKAKNLIIWGQSLKNDPHIEKIIKELFIKNNEIRERNLIIIDKENIHKIQKHWENKTPIFINPQSFENLEDLIKEIERKMN